MSHTFLNSKLLNFMFLKTSPRKLNDDDVLAKDLGIETACDTIGAASAIYKDTRDSLYKRRSRRRDMIRACRIPPVLNRICDDKIPAALLVTMDGELLGASDRFPHHKDPESFGTLVAEIAADYHNCGVEYVAVDNGGVHRSKSHLQCLLIEMDGGMIGVSACLGIDCFVLCVAKPHAPPGLVKARLQSLAVHVQESLSTLTESAA
jgi:hypothetical protein